MARATSDQTEFGMAAETILVFTGEAFSLRTTLADGDSVEARGPYTVVGDTLVSPEMDKGRPMRFRIELEKKLVITLHDGTPLEYEKIQNGQEHLSRPATKRTGTGDMKTGKGEDGKR